MPRSDFYHLQRFRLEDALPRLLDRVLKTGQRAVVLAGSADRVEDLTVSLWGHRDLWLPHGSIKDGHAADQPIWMTHDPEDCPNGAKILLLCDGMDSPLSDRLDRTLDLFDGHDPTAVQAARDRWKGRLDRSHELYYWQQDEAGRWVEKARRVPEKNSDTD